MHEHPVAVADSRDDASGNVVLHLENARRLEVPAVRLGPELRSRLDVDQLGVDPNGGTALADASFQHVARAEPGALGPLVSGLFLQTSRRRARDHRQIPKPRKAGDDLLGEPVGQRHDVGVGSAALERQHRDPKTPIRPDLTRIDRRRLRGCARPGRRRRRGLRLQVAKLVEHVARRLVAVARVLLQAAAENSRQMRRQVRAQLRNRRGLVAQDRGDHVHRARAVERTFAGQHLIEHDAEREDVGPRVDLPAARLLGRHVGHRAEDLALPGQLDAARRRHVGDVRVGVRRVELGETEVEHLDSSLARDHDVGRLQVPVHDAALVGRGQGVGERNGDLEETGEREASGRDGRVEAVALDSSMARNRVSPDCSTEKIVTIPGWLSAASERGLALEASQPLGVLRHVLREHLDRHVAPEPRVPRPVNLPHPARPQRRKDLVGTETGAGGDRHLLVSAAQFSTSVIRLALASPTTVLARNRCPSGEMSYFQPVAFFRWTSKSALGVPASKPESALTSTAISLLSADT